MTTYPEHDKLKIIMDNGNAELVQEFLDWLLDDYRVPGTSAVRDDGDDATVTLAFWQHRDENGREYLNTPLMPAPYNRERLMYAFFKLDKSKIDAEKDAMLDEIRKANA